jgi:hypothetical protein
MNHDYETVAIAEGYLELGEFEEAWEFIESIPASLRMNPAILRVRIISAVALKQFGMAEELAEFLGNGPAPYRKFAGHILHEIAAVYCIAGDNDHARQLVGEAIRIWPHERLAILDDPTFKDLF